MHHSQRSNKTSKPKRALSAYNFFFREERKLIQKTYLAENGQQASYPIISKLVAAGWKTIGTKEKQRFELLSTMDKCRYGVEIVEWHQQQQQEQSPPQTNMPAYGNVCAQPVTSTPSLADTYQQPITVESTVDMQGGMSSLTSSFLARSQRGTPGSLLCLPEATPSTLSGSDFCFAAAGNQPHCAFEPLPTDGQLINTFDEDDVHYLAELYSPTTL